MYGVAQELLNLVKATAPAQPSTSDPGLLAFPDDDTTLPVYRKLARILGDPEGDPDAPGPTRVRFVVDLISGSSAGGLNGVCLATVLANDEPGGSSDLVPMEELWIRHGGLETLLAGEESARDDAGNVDERLLMADAPPSLLNGARFYKMLSETLYDKLAKVPSEASHASRLVDQLDLWVTATDLEGRTVNLPIENATVSERQHAYRFHFMYDPALRENDFTKEVAPFVAFAGRATSSFPVAFEPMRLERILPFHGIPPDWHERFYADTEPGAFARISLSDGGILDNKPFSYATQELSRRPATLPVDRYLVYVEPDPKLPDETPRRAWNALETALAAMVGIPHTETIRGDLEVVRARNRAIRRARRVLFETALTPEEQQRHALIASRIDRAKWRKMGLTEMLAAQSEFGPTYPVYHRLKVNAVCEYLARLLARTLGLEESGEDLPKLRAIVDVWKRDRYQEDPEDAAGDGFPHTETEFLFRFDAPFRVRRLANVLTRLRDLESGDEDGVKRFFESAGCTPVPVDDDEVRAIRRWLGIALDRLVQVEQRLPYEPALRASLAESGIDRATVAAMDADRDDLLLAQVPGGIATRGDPIDVVVEAAVREATEQAKLAVETALGDRVGREEVEELRAASAPELRRVVRFYYDAFEAFDLVYLPLSFETAVADTNEVRIVRISPLDAERPLNVSRTLMGAGLKHFGAFIDASWRQHDIAWGRLNAAEILIRNLLPDERGLALVDEAHAVIQDHYAAGLTQVEGLPTTVRGDDGQPLLRELPLTATPPKKDLLNRAAEIASATVQSQLEANRSPLPARAVRVGTDAAQGKGFPTLLLGLHGLLPPKGRLVVWIVPLLLVSLAVILAVAGVTWASALVFGVLLGAVALVSIGVAVARSRVRAAFDQALDRL
jgi:patatin-related protein